MKYNCFTAIIVVLCLLSHSVVAQTGYNRPSKLQLSQIARGYGMFIHFGINTFNETEWSDGKLPAQSFNPTELNCDQWVHTAKEAGFRYVILVAKHHDGFCLWNSRYTDYDVASATVKTDIVTEVSKACKKYGLAMGLYYSLWDRHEPAHNNKNPQLYVNYMKNQITELLTGYGKICELWFDGGWAKRDADWHLAELYGHIKKLQPNCLVTVNHTIKMAGQNRAMLPSDMQQGDTIRYYPVDFRTKDPNMTRWDDPKLYWYNDTLRYLPFEHTICLSDRWNWFQKKASLPVRSLDELEELFYLGTANNNMLIVNIPPDQTGRLRQHEVNQVLALADRLGIRGGNKQLPAAPVNLAFGNHVTASNEQEKNNAALANDYSIETFWMAEKDTASLTIHFDSNVTFNRILLLEKYNEKQLGDGFSVQHLFAIEAYSIETYNGICWTTIFMGNEIGACKTIHLPVQHTAQKIRLQVSKAKQPAGIYHFAVANYTGKQVRKILE
ncbi:MAG: alpha-L-fucosidase [Dinghuibacter sp.]|nr:alpha-L-fucosidase [Dinghuibacter sp.]